MKESDIDNALMLLAEMAPRFSIVSDPKENPIPVEVKLPEVLVQIDAALRKGWNLNPPSMGETAGRFTGMQLLLTEPRPGQPGKPPIKMVLNIHTDLEDMACMTDQNLIGYAVMAVVFSSFMAKAKAEKEKKDAELIAKATAEAKDNITKFPSPEPEAKQ